MFINYFDCLPFLIFWWKYLAVLSVNTDYAWKLLNCFYSQNYLQQYNPEMAVDFPAYWKAPLQTRKDVRKDRSSQEKSIGCSHGQQGEWYLQNWCDWNMWKIHSFLGENWEKSWVNICSCFQQFDPVQLRSIQFTVIAIQSSPLHFCSVSEPGDRTEDMPLSLKILWTD